MKRQGQLTDLATIPEIANQPKANSQKAPAHREMQHMIDRHQIPFACDTHT